MRSWLATFQSQTGGFESMALSPNGRILAAGVTAANAASHNIQLWDTTTGSPMTTFTGPEYCHVYQLAFDPDNATLAVGLSVPMVRLWDVANATTLLRFPTPRDATSSHSHPAAHYW